MHQPVSNIKIIKLDNGDDIVCSLPEKQYPDDHALLMLEKPLQIKYIPQFTPEGFRDHIALTKWAAYTTDEIVTIPKQKIMTITSASTDMARSYTILSEEYNKPRVIEKNDNYEQKRLSDDENKELNEIFQPHEEEEPTLH